MESIDLKSDNDTQVRPEPLRPSARSTASARLPICTCPNRDISTESPPGMRAKGHIWVAARVERSVLGSITYSHEASGYVPSDMSTPPESFTQLGPRLYIERLHAAKSQLPTDNTYRQSTKETLKLVRESWPSDQLEYHEADTKEVQRRESQEAAQGYTKIPSNELREKYITGSCTRVQEGLSSRE